MYIFAEPVTEEQADTIQNRGAEAQAHFTRTVVGLGKDDPEVQEAWEDIQDSVDEQMDSDSNANVLEGVADQDQAEQVRESEEEDEGKVSELEQDDVDEVQQSAHEAEDGDEANVEESADSISTEEYPTKGSSTEDMASRGPLMGWTLTTRSQVNGGYVDRPSSFGEEDEWKLEYNIQQIPDGSAWRLYDALTERRRQQIGAQEQDEIDDRLKQYRNLIKRYSMRGREWREQQDKLNDEVGVEIYKPLGPGSDAAKAAVEDNESKTD